VREFHSDNGSEFINQVIADWHRNPACPIPFTRSRDYKKNDNCFVEQKNGAVVREYIGYDRLEGEALQSRLAAVYRSLVPLLNFFMPTIKLESKMKAGSKEIKTYDAPRSPYQRLGIGGAVARGESGTEAVLRALESGSVTTQCEQVHPHAAGGRRRSVPFLQKGARGIKLLFSK
jgi:hypothetical protein